MDTDLALMIADMFPLEMMVEMLKESLKDYELDPSEENRQKLIGNCMMIATKQAVDAHGGLEQTMKHLDEIKTAKALYDKNLPKQ